MKATIYVKDIPCWKRAKKRALECRLSLSEYIQIALERMERYEIDKKIIIELKSK